MNTTDTKPKPKKLNEKKARASMTLAGVPEDLQESTLRAFDRWYERHKDEYTPAEYLQTAIDAWHENKDKKRESIPERVCRLREVYLKYRDLFFTHFNVPLSGFWDKLTGFDCIKFDEMFLQPPDGVSTCAHCEAIYGAGAKELLRQIIESEKAPA